MIHENPNKLVVYDTTAPLELFAKNGYYQVGNNVFNYKITALQEATRTRSEVKWVFNDDAFSKIDWTTSNYLPLSEMYRLRALQLREQYDYLMLGWSGGADSTTILDTFLDNNIRLDEVVVLWAVSMSNGKYTPNKSLHATNLSSEWDFVVKPKIEQLRVKYPNLKITVRDTTLNHNDVEYKDDSMLIIDKHNYFTLARVRDLDRLLRERSNQYHNIGYMTGVSPPDLFIVGEKVYTCFPDSHTTPTAKSDYTLEGWTRNIEFFYWSPDMPELIREQCHALLRVMNTDRSFRRYFKRSAPTGQVISWPDYDVLRYVRKPFLYPNYPQDTLQVGKPDDVLNYHPWFKWFYDDPHAEEFVQPLNSAHRAQHALIDPKYIVRSEHVRQNSIMTKSSVVGYKPLNSKPYYIGKLDMS